MKHIPRKRFGQNFLVDAAVIESIIAAIAPCRSERIVEIGPGLAALSAPLLECLDFLDVIEIDRDLAERLRDRFPASRACVHSADALLFDYAALARMRGGSLRLVGNLPYNISTPLLFHLAGFADVVDDMHFMLQREVVERMIAVPEHSEYGRLSVMLQYRFIMAPVLDVPPEAFRPQPKVDSKIIRMQPKPRHELLARDEAGFASLVSAAFSQRRKMLRNTLKNFCPMELLITNGIDPAARAETLSVADYVRLANALPAKGDQAL